MTPQFEQRLADAFYETALWLKERIERDGWRTFSSNCLREVVRCRYGYRFSNTISPVIYDKVKREHPELARWIVTNEHAGQEEEREPSLF